MVLMLSGCGKPESFETLSDEYLEAELAPAQQTSFLLGEEAVSIENPTEFSNLVCELML